MATNIPRFPTRSAQGLQIIDIGAEERENTPIRSWYHGGVDRKSESSAVIGTLTFMGNMKWGSEWDVLQCAPEFQEMERRRMMWEISCTHHKQNCTFRTMTIFRAKTGSVHRRNVQFLYVKHQCTPEADNKTNMHREAWQHVIITLEKKNIHCRPDGLQSEPVLHYLRGFCAKGFTLRTKIWSDTCSRIGNRPWKVTLLLFPRIKQ